MTATRPVVRLLLLASALFATPASAQWTRVANVPITDVFSVWTNGDTIAAGVDTAVYLSTNAGASWKRSALVVAGAEEVNAVRVRNGRLYAGTFQRGVFISDDLGDHWSDYNQGLGGPGSLVIIDMLLRGDSLYVATDGSGPWVRNLKSGTWSPFSAGAIANGEARDMTVIAGGGSRLFAAGGFNGTVFYRDPGQPDWTLSLLFNDRFAPGLAALAATWTGRGWVVGANNGVYFSATGQEPWTFVDLGINPILFVGFALRGSDVFASFGAGGGSLIAMSHDDGATWQGLDSLFSVFVYDLARQETTLYAGRVDGLWRRSIANVSSVPGGAARPRLTFSIAGPQPVGDQVRFAFDLPAAGLVVIEVFDISGRRVGEALRDVRPAGRGEISWDAGRLPAGVYHARMTAAGEHAAARLVRASARP